MELFDLAQHLPTLHTFQNLNKSSNLRIYFSLFSLPRVLYYFSLIF